MNTAKVHVQLAEHNPADVPTAVDERTELVLLFGAVAREFRRRAARGQEESPVNNMAWVNHLERLVALLLFGDPHTPRAAHPPTREAA